MTVFLSLVSVRSCGFRVLFKRLLILTFAASITALTGFMRGSKTSLVEVGGRFLGVLTIFVDSRVVG